MLCCGGGHSKLFERAVADAGAVFADAGAGGGGAAVADAGAGGEGAAVPDAGAGGGAERSRFVAELLNSAPAAEMTGFKRPLDLLASGAEVQHTAALKAERAAAVAGFNVGADE